METQAQELGTSPAKVGSPASQDINWQAWASRLVAGLHFRIIATCLIAAATFALVTDIMHPMLVTGAYQGLAQSLADELKDQLPQQPQILQLIRQHNLAWYYITDASGKVVANTQAYCPQLEGTQKNSSHEDKWLGKRYFDAVVPLKGQNFLHVGFYVSPMIFSQLFSLFFVIEPCPLGPMLAIFFGLLLCLVAVNHVSVVKPLNQLAGSADLPADAAAVAVPDLSLAVLEIKVLAEITDKLLHRLTQAISLAGSASVPDAQIATAERGDVEVSNTQNRIAEFYTKDAEEEFINMLGRELDSLKSSHQLCQRVLDKLNDKFPTSIVYGVMFKSERDSRFVAEAFLGFDDRTVQIIKRVDHKRIATEAFGAGSYLTLTAESMRDYGLQSLLASVSVKSAVYLPLSFQNRNLGMLAVYFRTEGKTVQDRMRFLRNAVAVISRSLYEVIIYEEELQAALTDPLTGVRNRKFLQELLPKAFGRASAKPEEQPVTLLTIHGDHFRDIVDTFGHAVSDQVLQSLAQTIKLCVRTSDGDGKGEPGDFLIRNGNEEFVLLMESTDASRALGIAERIRNAVYGKSEWPGNISKWSVSIGVASYPQDARNSEDLLAKTNTAVHYIKDEMGGNKVCHIKQVPEGYKASKETAAIGGELGVFDPAALLQSLATAQKTGILTVRGREDKQLWMLFEGGRPVQARLGKFGGALAIVEFVTTFEEGSFNFQEKLFGPNETITKLPRLDAAYNVQKGLERCLMDGALALDNFNAAKAVVTSDEIVIKPIGAVEFSARWQALTQLPEPPTQEEFGIMSDIIQHADGKTPLSEIFQRMDSVPTSRLWRSAALLVQHGLVSKLSGLPV
jgi:diguanylate cyclase (GGDEF)-like protein